LCDVGGGTGGMLREVLSAHPAIAGVLFDLPEVVAQAGVLPEGASAVGGSFFDSVPEGCDVYMLQAIIHDWDDDSCVTILSNCRKAMASGGRVLVIENVLSPEPGPADQFARTFDLVMLVTSGLGRERTLAQFKELFARAGLRLRRNVTLPSMFHVLELEADHST
ncbi:MAG: methyltransferase, partial [Actinomycetota bacterium]